jgi:hypothetical protein
MYKIIATQNREASTPLNGFPIEGIEEDMITFNLGEFNSRYKKTNERLANIIVSKFDGKFDIETGDVFVNDEKVYNLKDDESIFNGMYFQIIVSKEKSEWKEVETPEGLSYKLSIKENKGCFDVKLNGNVLLWLCDFVKLKKKLIGRKVFWLDPNAIYADEHTSNWKTITKIKNDWVLLDDGTEAFIDECYI